MINPIITYFILCLGHTHLLFQGLSSEERTSKRGDTQKSNHWSENMLLTFSKGVWEEGKGGFGGMMKKWTKHQLVRLK